MADSIASIHSTTQLLVDFWFRAFRKRKWTTLISTFIFFAGFVSVLIYSDQKEKRELERAKKESLILTNRIAELEKVEFSLKSLQEFIEHQKEAIVNTEKSIKDLEQKKNELEPIVKTQEATIEAILRQQDERNFQNRWVERFIGFGLGIAASIIASIVYGLFSRLKLKK